MEKKAQMEFEPAYVALAILGGLIAFFVCSYAIKQSGGSKIIPFVALILGTAITYAYLALSDRG